MNFPSNAAKQQQQQQPQQDQQHKNLHQHQQQDGEEEDEEEDDTSGGGVGREGHLLLMSTSQGALRKLASALDQDRERWQSEREVWAKELASLQAGLTCKEGQVKLFKKETKRLARAVAEGKRENERLVRESARLREDNAKLLARNATLDARNLEVRRQNDTLVERNRKLKITLERELLGDIPPNTVAATSLSNGSSDDNNRATKPPSPSAKLAESAPRVEIPKPRGSRTSTVDNGRGNGGGTDSSSSSSSSSCGTRRRQRRRSEHSDTDEIPTPRSTGVGSGGAERKAAVDTAVSGRNEPGKPVQGDFPGLEERWRVAAEAMEASHAAGQGGVLAGPPPLRGSGDDDAHNQRREDRRSGEGGMGKINTSFVKKETGSERDEDEGPVGNESGRCAPLPPTSPPRGLAVAHRGPTGEHDVTHISDEDKGRLQSTRCAGGGNRTSGGAAPPDEVSSNNTDRREERPLEPQPPQPRKSYERAPQTSSTRLCGATAAAAAAAASVAALAAPTEGSFNQRARPSSVSSSTPKPPSSSFSSSSSGRKRSRLSLGAASADDKTRASTTVGSCRRSGGGGIEILEIRDAPRSTRTRPNHRQSPVSRSSPTKGRAAASEKAAPSREEAGATGELPASPTGGSNEAASGATRAWRPNPDNGQRFSRLLRPPDGRVGSARRGHDRLGAALSDECLDEGERASTKLTGAMQGQQPSTTRDSDQQQQRQVKKDSRSSSSNSSSSSSSSKSSSSSTTHVPPRKKHYQQMGKSRDGLCGDRRHPGPHGGDNTSGEEEAAAAAAAAGREGAKGGEKANSLGTDHSGGGAQDVVYPRLTMAVVNSPTRKRPRSLRRYQRQPQAVDADASYGGTSVPRYDGRNGGATAAVAAGGSDGPTDDVAPRRQPARHDPVATKPSVKSAGAGQSDEERERERANSGGVAERRRRSPPANRADTGAGNRRHRESTGVNANPALDPTKSGGGGSGNKRGKGQGFSSSDKRLTAPVAGRQGLDDFLDAGAAGGQGATAGGEGKRGSRTSKTGYKYQEVVRDRAKRATMKGHDCEHCAAYLAAVGGSPGEREAILNMCSRHRYTEANGRPADTPDGFWNLSFPDSVHSDKDPDHHHHHHHQ